MKRRGSLALRVFLMFSLLVSCSFVKNGTKIEGQKPLVAMVPLAAGEKMENHISTSQNVMVVTQGIHSTEAGLKMLKMGGNIYDAACAVSFALGVERPQSTGIGGGGFLLYFEPGMDVPMAMDFREKAPLAAHEKMFQDAQGKLIPRKSVDTVFAGGVPGLVAGIVELHEKKGKLPLSVVLEPAISLAEKGFIVYPHLAMSIKDRAEVISKYKASKAIFFNSKGMPLAEGDLLVQKDLARSLGQIATKGKDGFYKGDVADLIVKEQRRLGGMITHEDLKTYTVKYRRPVVGTYKNYDLYSMSPPSSGGIHVLEILNILENDQLKQYGPQSATTLHLTASAMQLAFADRAKYLGDSDFVQVPIKGLLSKDYARKLRAQISLDRAMAQKEISAGNPFPYESDQTTHFTIMDQEGRTIVSTQTVNDLLGSGIVIPGTGIVLNNEMDDFTSKVGQLNIYGAVGGEKNQVAPRKRPLSSMSPTIVLQNRHPVLALGSPSGTRILTCVAQTILNYLEHRLPLYDSVAAIRFHHQWYPDEIRIDSEGTFPEVTVNRLKEMGHKVNFSNLGCRVQAVALESGKLIGVSDPRGTGLARGH